MVKALHLNPETEEQLDERLKDAEGRKRSDPADVFPQTVERIHRVEVDRTQPRVERDYSGGYRG